MNKNTVSGRSAVEPVVQPQETSVAASDVQCLLKQFLWLKKRQPIHQQPMKDRRNYVTYCRNRLFTTSTR